MTASNDILIVAESFDKRLPAAAQELLGAALQVARPGGGRVLALLLGETGDELVGELIACGAERVYVAQNTGLADQPVEARLPAIVEACRRAEPRLVLFAHGVSGAELAPRLAFRLGGAAATGCVEFRLAADAIECTRPCYGGIARAVDRFAAHPLIATVRAGVFEPAPRQPGRTAELVAIEPNPAVQPRTRVLARNLDASQGQRLEDARAIVAGGRGLEGPEGFRVLEELASAIDAALGASRVPCDLGWCPHSWQIGLTGKTVTPELYIAVGISGAGHHMAGCGNAKTIVAINTDPKAAIFQDARFGVVADYREVVPALAAELRRLKRAS